ncbi:hypothetical protein FOA52_012351 [Chlamydomonas sp. UWO 241]|nr:hypothetical protein FOA52_012351 [Chlamydomonas sp. UWO 241]
MGSCVCSTMGSPHVGQPLATGLAASQAAWGAAILDDLAQQQSARSIPELAPGPEPSARSRSGKVTFGDAGRHSGDDDTHARAPPERSRSLGKTMTTRTREVAGPVSGWIRAGDTYLVDAAERAVETVDAERAAVAAVAAVVS